MAAPKSGKTKKKELDEEQVTFLVSIGCTRAEIAAFFGCHVDTLRDNYSKALETGVDIGKLSARRKMWMHFNNGNNLGIKYVIHNILKEKFEDYVDKNKDDASNELMEKLASVSTDMILKLIKGDKVG